jgi:hypothetical protein
VRRLLPWVLVAVGILALAHAASVATHSTLVALGGVFVAVQLVAPVLVDRRRMAGRRAPSARRPSRTAADRKRPGRVGAVAWIRLNANHRWTVLNAPRFGPVVAAIPVATPARRSP